jgi:excisionase family DNA binding protein
MLLRVVSPGVGPGGVGTHVRHQTRGNVMADKKKKKDFKDKEVFTTYDAARICNANIASIKNWIAKGLLRAFRTPGGHYRIKRRDLELFVQKYNMPYPFEEKAQKSVYMLDTDKKAIKAVEGLLNVHRFAGFSDSLHAALNIGLERPDAIIIDVKAKGFDGGAFLDLLYAYPDTRNILVVVYSKGLSQAEAMDLRKKYNLEDIVDKGGDEHALLAAFQHLA